MSKSHSIKPARPAKRAGARKVPRAQAAIEALRGAALRAEIIDAYNQLRFVDPAPVDPRDAATLVLAEQVARLVDLVERRGR